MKRRWAILVLGLALVVGGPWLEASKGTLDFDIHVSKVESKTTGGSVEVTSLTKVEALASGDVLSETTFFYPASPDAIVSLFTSPEGICAASALCASARKVGPTSDGKGWTGEIQVDMDRIKDKAKILRTAWSPAALRKLQTTKERRYTIGFELRVQDEGAVKAIHFRMASGRVFTKLEATMRVFAGGSAASLVTFQSLTRSTLADDVTERVLLAKRLVRASPQIVDEALTGGAAQQR